MGSTYRIVKTRQNKGYYSFAINTTNSKNNRIKILGQFYLIFFFISCQIYSQSINENSPISHSPILMSNTCSEKNYNQHCARHEMSKLINESNNYNSNNLDLGNYKAIIKFSLDTIGNITIIKINTTNDVIENILLESFNSLPKTFYLLDHNGKKINDEYVLPFYFQVFE